MMAGYCEMQNLKVSGGSAERRNWLGFGFLVEIGNC